MATFEITGPDGSVYRIDAPEGASAFDARQKLFSNLAEQLPPQDIEVARTKNDAFGKYLRTVAAEPKEGETPEQHQQRLYGKISQQQDVSVPGGLARQYLQGGTFGYGDEIVGGATASLDALLRDVPIEEAYRQRVGNERAAMREFSKEHPALSIGAEIAGAIPSSIVASPAGRGFLKTLGTATGQGVVYGSGIGEGSAEDRLKKAITVGGLSAGIVGAAYPLAAGAGRLTRMLAERRLGQSLGTSGPAAGVLTRALAGAPDSGAIVREAGPTAVIADAPAGLGVLDAAIQSGGEAANVAQRNVQGRAGQAGVRLARALDESLGQPQGALSQSKDIAKTTAPARKTAYDEAYAATIDYGTAKGRKIIDIVKRIRPSILKQAIDDADEMMLADGYAGGQFSVDVLPSGAVKLIKSPSVMQLDYLKRALGNLADAEYKAGLAAKGSLHSGLAKELKKAIVKVVPEYGVAVKLGGDKIARDKGLALGLDVLKSKTTREIVSEALDDASDDVVRAVKAGLRISIDDIISNVKRAMTSGDIETVEAMRTIKELSSRANRDKVTQILGKAESDRLFKYVDEAATAFSLRGSVATGSRTFGRIVAHEGIEQAVQGGPLASIRRGEGVVASKKLVAAVLGGSPSDLSSLSDEGYLQLARVLTGPSGKNATILLRQIMEGGPRIQQQAQGVRNLAEALSGRGPVIAGPLSNPLGG
jgi:hypothetical protein